ncbi:nuclear transport factor 2 family protein [Hellea sp.]|nr:nuclear transport factor 2 family protein [Hellea sp.]
MRAHRTIKSWHEMVAAKDLSKLGDFLDENAVFKSPMAHTPYPGKFAVYFALSNVLEVFENFNYHREFIADDGRSAVLEFTADVSGKSLKGVDIITFDEDGLITEFEVLIRPMSGLTALAAQMAPRMAKMSKQ